MTEVALGIWNQKTVFFWNLKLLNTFLSHLAIWRHFTTMNQKSTMSASCLYKIVSIHEDNHLQCFTWIKKPFFKNRINHFEENIFCAFKHLNQLERRKTVEKEESTWKFNDYLSKWIENCKINVHLASQNWIIN